MLSTIFTQVSISLARRQSEKIWRGKRLRSTTTTTSLFVLQIRRELRFFNAFDDGAICNQTRLIRFSQSHNMFGFKKRANLNDLQMHCIRGVARCTLVRLLEEYDK